MLNGIHECGLSKQQQVKIQNFPGGTSEIILDVVDLLVTDKPDCTIVHAGTNDITKGINSLNSVNKIVKKVKQTSSNTKLVFSSLITRKDKKDLDEKVQDVNNGLKNYCMQTNLDYIENNNIKKEHLGNKKLHLNKKGNTVLPIICQIIYKLLFEMLILQTVFRNRKLNINLRHSMNLPAILLSAL